MSHQYQPTHSAPPPPPQHQHTEDNRGGVIKSIWGCSIGMLGICIPLVPAMNAVGSSSIGSLLPFCIIAGATLATLGIWFVRGSSTPKSQSPSSSEAALQAKIHELEERLFNVETMSTFERGLMERDSRVGMTESLPDPVTPSGRAAKQPPPISY